MPRHRTISSAIGLCAFAVALWVMPESIAQTIVTIAIPVFVGLGIVGVARQPRGQRRPLVWISTGAVGLFASLIIRTVHGSIDGSAFPYPSPADVVALLSYTAVFVGIASIARARRAFGGQGDVIDVVMLTVALAGPFWVGVLDGYFHDDSFSPLHRALSGIYGITEVAFVALMLRLATGPGNRPRSFYMLAAWTTALALFDALAILDTIGGPGASLLVPMSFLGFAAFPMFTREPDLGRLLERPPASDPRLTTSRLITLTVAMAMIPLLLALQFLGGTSSSSVTLGFVAVLSMMVLTRVLGLLRSRDRIASFDEALRGAGRRLIAATDVSEVAEVVESIMPVITDSRARYSAVLRSKSASALSVLSLEHHDMPIRSECTWDQADDEATLIQSVDGVDDESETTFLLFGARGQQGGIFVDPGRRLENAEQLALQTLSAHVTMALRSLDERETLYRRRAEQRLRALVEQSADVVVVTDRGKIIFLSPNARRVIGRAPADMIDRRPGDLAHPDDRERLERHLGRVGPGADAMPAVEVRLASSDGDYRWFDLTARDFSDDPEVGGVVITARDVTEERAAKLGLLRSEQWFRGLVQNSSDAIAVVDDQGVFTYASPALDRLLGIPSEQIRAHNLLEFLDPTDGEGSRDLRQAFSTESSESRTVELRMQRADEEFRIAEVTVTDLRRDPSVQGLVLNIRDITDRKRLENDLRHQVLHDDLTGLGSRVQFTTQLSDALGPQRRSGSQVAALFIDLDDFKNINDSLGHAAGDLVLVEISSRLQGRLRLHDRAARFGGDEFAVLLTDVYGESDVTMVADRIVEELSRPVELMGQEVRLSVSIGIAIDEDGTNTPEDLLRSADVAMYEAKGQGKGRWAMFADEMADQTIERFEITNSLGAAIENDELMVYYQPILDLGSGQTRGVEALVRWKHPVRGMVNPGAFIPLAERNGLIVPLGRRVLEKAVEQVARWRHAGHDIYASVNISPVQLQLDGIVAEVLEIVDSAGMDRNAVVLELTESALINDFELVVARIDQLRAAGIRVAIDDFGTGYATLRYAEEFSADILKIDQTFVARLETQDDSTIVSTVLAIAESMGAQTVAEGIEVPDQHRRLMALGCQLGQGYYFTRPAPPAVIGELLARELEGEALVGHAH